ncbi:O-antigen ligase family protein [Arthrobacter sp. SAFR-014]|uniref:O-antigen ligase family protein n=1 Tax=unclassified Arthrobacter TaxID=235627 RepID=UPI003F7CCC76
MLTTVLVATGAVTLVVLIQLARKGRFEWDFGSLLIIGVGWAYQVPTIAAKLTDSQVYRIGPLGEKTVAGLGWADRLVSLSDYAALAMAVVAILVSVARAERLSWAPVAIPMIGITLVGTLVTAMKTASFPSGQPLMLITLLVASALVRTSKRAVVTGVSILVLSSVLMSTVIAVLRPDAAIQQCVDKCTFAGEILTGGFSHGNGLALFVTLGIVFTWLVANGKSQLWITGYLLLIVALSGSRTSLVSAVLTVFVLTVTKASLVRGRVTGRRSIFGVVAALGACIIALIVALIPHEDTFVTGRGYLWRLALSVYQETPAFGAGATAWSELFADRAFGAAAAYSTHNMWIEALLISGTAGALLMATFIYISLVRARLEQRLILAPVFVGLFSLGVFERPLSMTLVDGFTWALLAIVMASSVGRRSQEDQHEAEVLTADVKVQPAVLLPGWATSGFHPATTGKREGVHSSLRRCSNDNCLRHG